MALPFATTSTEAPDLGITVRVDGEPFTGWEQVEIHRSLDNFSTASFTAPFEAERASFRETFRPFSYKPMTIEAASGEVFFTGKLVGVEPDVQPDSRTVIASCYSLPAVLSDSNPPASAFPLELNKLDLQQIAEQLAAPFDVRVTMLDPAGTPFRRVKLEATSKIHDFLITLAQQRGLVIADSPEGDLIFQMAVGSGSPVATFEQGLEPLLSVAATFSPQAYYSELTGIAKKKAGKRGSKYTETNPRLSGVVRPLTFTLGDTTPGDLPSAVKAKMGRMFGNMVRYVVTVPTWQDAKGTTWAPNTSVNLTAPDAMVYRKTELLVRDTILKMTAEETTASLGLCLPGAFSGEAPGSFPWDG